MLSIFLHHVSVEYMYKDRNVIEKGRGTGLRAPLSVLTDPSKERFYPDFLYLVAFESNTNSDWLYHTVCKFQRKK